MAGGTAVSAVELPASFDDTHLLSRFLGAGREREDEGDPQEEPRQDRMTRQIQRGRMTDEDKATALGRISTGSEYSAFAYCDLVVEAATEDEEIKHRTWICACDDMQIYKYCHCLLFLNEEGLPITEYLPEDHEGRKIYGLVKDPTPDKGRVLRHKAAEREIERKERPS